MKRIVAYEIVDHGFEHAEYFSGVSALFTGFDDAVTGMGMDRDEAFSDVLDMIAADGIETDQIEEEFGRFARQELTLEEQEIIIETDIFYYVSVLFTWEQK